ncbi:MAG: hypothetical protein J5552_02340 [Prevotella sp.]|nr:hypothetical protein [Prevotella sp.]
MESKKNNYNKPATLVVKIQQRGHLLDTTPGGQEQGPGGGNAREHRSDWGSED